MNVKQYWLVKSEPEEYSWNDLERDEEVVWSGVKNHQAKNNMRRMEIGDEVLFYHSGKSPGIVGIAIVSKTAYPDPTDEDWEAVNLIPLRKMEDMVSLKEIKSDTYFKTMPLVRQPRLSVMPVDGSEFEKIQQMAVKQY